MARQITVLETNPGAGGMITIRCAFWFPVTIAVPKPTYISVILGASAPTGIESSALQAGTVIEEVNTYVFPGGTSPATLKADLLAYYQARAAFLAAQPIVGQYYGVIYDSVALWSA
jgi:hypothetical protein